MSTSELVKKRITAAYLRLGEYVNKANHSKASDLWQIIEGGKAVTLAARMGLAEIMLENKDFAGAVKMARDIDHRDPGNDFAKLLIDRYQHLAAETQKI